MSRRVLLASSNDHKLAELRRLIATAGLDLEVVGLADVPAYPEPVEDADTFEGNALIKSRAGVEHTGLPTIADDSGLEVDVLNKMPGVRSARWAGPARDDRANNQLLLAQLSDVPPARRRARFVCAAAASLPGGAERVCRGEIEGVIVDAPRGENGFGYDPLFQPLGEHRTTAELTAAEKDAISHRGKALRALLPELARMLDD